MFTFPPSLIAGSGFVSAIPDPDHYYVMDGTGNAADNGATGGADLTENGTITEVTGKSGNGRSAFSTANYFQESSTTISTAIDEPDWSLSVWVKTPSALPKFALSTSSNTFYLYITTSSVIWYDGSTAITHSTTIAASTWYHVAIGRTSSGRWATVDDETPTTDADTASGVTGSFQAGKHSTTSPWDSGGIIDELAIWDGVDIRGDALTELYGSGTGKFWSGSAWA